MAGVEQGHSRCQTGGGFLTAEDEKAYDSWYWVAPAEFLGDKSAALNGTLRFSLKQKWVDSPFDQIDVVLWGTNIRLECDAGANPGTEWTHYECRLNDSYAWHNATSNAKATNDDIEAVLKNLTALWIRGEFRVGDDESSLDNVAFVTGSADEPIKVERPEDPTVRFVREFEGSFFQIHDAVHSGETFYIELVFEEEPTDASVREVTLDTPVGSRTVSVSQVADELTKFRSEAMVLDITTSGS
jgi:hypothetical protein